MLQSTPISLAWWISVFIISLATGCANRAPSLRVLDTRAEYGSELNDEDLALYQRGRKHPDTLSCQPPKYGQFTLRLHFAEFHLF